MVKSTTSTIDKANTMITELLIGKVERTNESPLFFGLETKPFRN